VYLYYASCGLFRLEKKKKQKTAEKQNSGEGREAKKQKSKEAENQRSRERKKSRKTKSREAESREKQKSKKQRSIKVKKQGNRNQKNAQNGTKKNSPPWKNDTSPVDCRGSNLGPGDGRLRSWRE